MLDLGETIEEEPADTEGAASAGEAGEAGPLDGLQSLALGAQSGPPAQPPSSATPAEAAMAAAVDAATKEAEEKIREAMEAAEKAAARRVRDPSCSESPGPAPDAPPAEGSADRPRSTTRGRRGSLAQLVGAGSSRPGSVSVPGAEPVADDAAAVEAAAVPEGEAAAASEPQSEPTPAGAAEPTTPEVAGPPGGSPEGSSPGAAGRSREASVAYNDDKCTPEDMIATLCAEEHSAATDKLLAAATDLAGMSVHPRTSPFPDLSPTCLSRYTLATSPSLPDP